METLLLPIAKYSLGYAYLVAIATTLGNLRDNAPVAGFLNAIVSCTCAAFDYMISTDIARRAVPLRQLQPLVP